MDMSYILVCARDSNSRRLYVDNLVLRGYIAVGTASVAEAHRLLQRELPRMVIICCVLDNHEEVVKDWRSLQELDTTPIVLVSPEIPDQAWMNLWGIVSYLPYPTDLRKLVQMLQPWLDSTNEHVSNASTTRQPARQVQATDTA